VASTRAAGAGTALEGQGDSAAREREGAHHRLGAGLTAVIDQGKVRAFSRRGRDWTRPYRRAVDACANLGCKAGLIDGEIIVQDEQGISDFEALRSAIHKAPHRIVFFAVDLLHLDGQDLWRIPLIERRAALRKLIEPDPRSPIQFSDHVDCDGAKFFKAAAELGLEGIVSKRVQSLYRGGPSRSWLKIKNMVEGEFVLLGTEIDDSVIPWALLAREQDGSSSSQGRRFSGRLPMPEPNGPTSSLRCRWTNLH
jgi:bifunctional non-homologous end joining protein LigD